VFYWAGKFVETAMECSICNPDNHLPFERIQSSGKRFLRPLFNEYQIADVFRAQIEYLPAGLERPLADQPLQDHGGADQLAEMRAPMDIRSKVFILRRTCRSDLYRLSQRSWKIPRAASPASQRPKSNHGFSTPSEIWLTTEWMRTAEKSWCAIRARPPDYPPTKTSTARTRRYDAQEL
jgi:hypothetical protein